MIDLTITKYTESTNDEIRKMPKIDAYVDWLFKTKEDIEVSILCTKNTI